MAELYNTESINTKNDFVNFLNFLLQHLKDHPEEWENTSLEDFLEAMQIWTISSDNYYMNWNLPEPSNVNWKAFADILCGASVQE